MSVSSVVLRDLGEMPDRFGQIFELVPREHLNWSPESWAGIPGESFSALGHACHLRDIEIEGYHVRIRRLITEENPALESLDGYELARQKRYSETLAKQHCGSYPN